MIMKAVYVPWNQLMKLPEHCVRLVGWLRGSVVERRSSAGELSLSCARPVADG